jgi:class 3 adenylate cyclase
VAPIQESLLETRLSALEGARSWSPRVISRFEGLLRSDDEDALFRVNAIRFAHERNIAEKEAVDLFLHATAVGLFTMDWMVVCPRCSSIVESFGSLRAVDANHYHCHFCQNDYEAALDDYIAVSFTVAPSVRTIAYHKPESLPAAQYLTNYAFAGRYVRGDVPAGSTCLSPRDVLERCTKACDFVPPGESRTFDLTIGEPGKAAGDYVINGIEAISGAQLLVQAGGRMVNEPQLVSVSLADDAWHYAGGKLALGPVRLVVRNDRERLAFVSNAVFALGEPHCSEILEFEPYLSAKRLMTTQTFRDLFRTEVIKSTEGIGIRDISLIFTDLKGSTALYERIGDLNAFALVQQHFQRLIAATVGHDGAVVKTLGDAVMAAFLTPADAVRAALRMQAETERFNETRSARDFILKVGIHRGAAIAVTLNERLDYFGQTVNIASRVGDLAQGGEICMTTEVHDAPGVAALLRDCAVSDAHAQLKGVQQAVPVWRVSMPTGTGAALRTESSPALPPS